MKLLIFKDTLFALYPPQEDEDIIERRIQPDMPIEHLGHRILVKCTQLQYDPLYIITFYINLIKHFFVKLNFI